MRTFLLSLTMLLLAPTAHGATIDLSGLPVGLQGTDTLVFPEATFVSVPGDFSVSSAGEICATSSGGCFFDFEVIFAAPVSDFSVDLGAAGSQDAVTISAFDGAGGLLGTAATAGAGGLPTLSLGFSGIARIEIDDMSSPSTGGYFYSNFQFDPVPEPGTVALGAAGLLAVAASRRYGARSQSSSATIPCCRAS